MVVIADTSFLIPLFLQDEDSRAAEHLLRKIGNSDLRIEVPALWMTEFGNTLLVAYRRGRLTEAEFAKAQDQSIRMPLSVQSFPNFSDLSFVSALAVTHTLSFYDATYLAMAMVRKGSLATSDQKLHLAAKAEGCLWESQTDSP